ncbi:2-ketocyclohexanecarboxyl-CoA hydrolase [Chytriomyces cf. hyalinus JEL632]|nr:2-ketocyclohexanecarboxyl-CoA hydrolase [Chytriomyces cf. hyalinus JEL632]
MSIQVQTKDGVCTLTLDNAKRANALSPSMVRALMEALDAAEADDAVRVLVLTGRGKFFCAGMDLASAQSAPEFESSRAVFERVASFPKPTIGRINGGALGGGVGIAFCTDIRIADSNAYFQFAEVSRGLVPAIISLYIVPQLGPSLSRQFFLTGEKISTQQLLQAGCLAAAVPTAALDETVAAYAKMLLAGGPGAQKTIKRLVSVVGSSNATEQEKSQTVKAVFEGMLRSEEAAYGMQAFLSKKAPNWAEFLKENKSKL